MDKSYEEQIKYYEKIASEKGPGEYRLTDEFNKVYLDETVAASMAKFDEKNKALYGETIKEELPKPDLRNGFIHVNYKNRPFISQIAKDTDAGIIEGNIPSMLYTAYAKHYGVVLSPSILHHCLAFTIAKFMDVCSEEMREFVVNHKGKKEITSGISLDEYVILEKNKNKVITDGAGDVTRVLASVTEQLQKAVLEDVKSPELINALTLNYKSASMIDKLVNATHVLSSVKSYYIFTCSIICGFPFVILKGELDEWRSLVEKIRALSCFFLRCVAECYPKQIIEDHKKLFGNKKCQKFDDWSLIEEKLGPEQVAKLKEGQVIDLPDIELYYYDFVGISYDISDHYSREARNKADQAASAKHPHIKDYRELMETPEYSEIFKQDMDKIQDEIKEREKSYRRYGNMCAMYNYLRNLQLIAINMTEARGGIDKTQFWNEAFTLTKKKTCGGPPYQQNGWIFDLIIETNREREVEFETGSQTLRVEMKSCIDIGFPDTNKTMKLSAGVFGYRCVDLSKQFMGDETKKMWTLEPVIGVNYDFPDETEPVKEIIPD